jgi:hypothetical protein
MSLARQLEALDPSASDVKPTYQVNRRAENLGRLLGRHAPA